MSEIIFRKSRIFILKEIKEVFQPVELESESPEKAIIKVY